MLPLFMVKKEVFEWIRTGQNDYGGFYQANGISWGISHFLNRPIIFMTSECLDSSISSIRFTRKVFHFSCSLYR
jgi:hypothetical protein